MKTLSTPDFHEVRVVNIETVSGCNLECVYCSLRNRPLGFMPVERLSRILDGFADAREDLLVALYLGGEPFLNKDFHELVRLTREKGFFNVRTHTNGTVRRPGLWREVFDAGLTSVVFSVDGSDPEDFERIRPGASFKVVRENIEECLAWAGGRVDVRVLCLVEEPKPLRMNAGLAGLEDRLMVMVDRPHAWLGNGQIAGATKCSQQAQNPCFFSLNHMAVDVDGNYLPCCLCLNSEAKLGSALELTARQAWEGPMEELREKQRQGVEFHPCSTCERYARPSKESL